MNYYELQSNINQLLSSLKGPYKLICYTFEYLLFIKYLFIGKPTIHTFFTNGILGYNFRYLPNILSFILTIESTKK